MPVTDSKKSLSLTPLELDLLELRVAISVGLENWALLENEMCVTLGSIIHDEPNAIATVVYYAPSGTETRVSIVTAAVNRALQFHRFGSQLGACWKQIVTQVNSAKPARNKIAHGHISYVNDSHHELMIFSNKAFVKPEDAAQHMRGESTVAVREFGNVFLHIVHRIREFRDVFQKSNLGSTDDQETMKRIVALADALTISATARRAARIPENI